MGDGSDSKFKKERILHIGVESLKECFNDLDGYLT